jgi:hypothetical protein
MSTLATLDPYAIDNSGSRINIYNINNGGSLFRMTVQSDYELFYLYLVEKQETKDTNEQSQWWS